MDAMTRIAAVAMIVTLPVAGCASRESRTAAPAAATPGAASAMTKTPDVSSLAGRWDGWMKGSGGVTAPVQVTVNPDGTYVSTIGAASGNGTFEVVDGRVLTKGHLSGSAFGAGRQSTVSMAERGGRPVMVGEGRDDRGPYSFELMKRN
jgi:hypothetical protein